MRKVILTIVFFQLFLSSYCQSFKIFNSLTDKADSAYRVRNYALSAKYYERAIELREDQKPEIFGGLYYSMACVYSLGKEKDKALTYLEMSFSRYHAKKKSTPVSAEEITKNADLDFLREEARFKQLLFNYFPKFEIDFLLAKEVSYSTVLEYLTKLSEINNQIVISDKIIYWQKSDTSFVFNDKTKTLQFPNVEVLKHKPIKFSNCTFKLNFVWANFNKARQDFPYLQLVFEHCTFDGKLLLHQVNFESPPVITKCNFKHDLGLNFIANDDQWGGFALDSCDLKQVQISIEAKSPIRINIRDNTSRPNSLLAIRCNDVDSEIFLRNKFPGSNLLIGGSKISVLKFESNDVNNLTIANTNINYEFDFQKSILKGKLLFYETYFSNEPVNDIDWKNLDGLRLGYLKSAYNLEGDEYMVLGEQQIGRLTELGVTFTSYEKKDSGEFISGEKVKDISDDQSFQELMGLYSMFLNLYKNKSDIESYNACFITIKELQSKRLKHLYEANKTFESYFRWKLSQLLKSYVRYGTDPARAIVISLYIVFAFGVFFFFFPSDWDVTSKTRLIQNFRDFSQKNEKGYIIPFVILIGGFALSLLNALTLSLNAFITLGFGNIPTHGIARYVCVIEGFLGWFLLSIFTVALINQVL